MKVIWDSIKATFVGGVLFLVPVVIFLIILEKAFSLTDAISVPIAKMIPGNNFLGMPFHRIISILFVLLICLIAGLIAKTKAAKRTIAKLENLILSNVPGYTMIKGISETITGGENLNFKKVVMARIEDSWQLGFLTEEGKEGEHAAIFVPAAPNPWEGSLYFMGHDRYKVVDMTIKEAIICIKQAGVGSHKILNVNKADSNQAAR